MNQSTLYWITSAVGILIPVVANLARQGSFGSYSEPVMQLALVLAGALGVTHSGSFQPPPGAIVKAVAAAAGAALFLFVLIQYARVFGVG